MHRFTPDTPSKADIKLIRSLGQKKFREEHGLFVVEGVKMVEEALQQKRFEVAAVYYTEVIGQEAMSRMTLLSSPSPALAVLRKEAAGGFDITALISDMQNRSVAAIPAPDTTGEVAGKYAADGSRVLMIALDSIRDPGNMGTIMRIADWFGVQHIFASPDCVDIYNPKTVQASMGAIFRKPVHYVDLQQTVRELTAAGVAVYATTLEGGRNIYSETLRRDHTLVIMGSENNGVSPELLSIVPDRLFIPPYPIDSLGSTSESLNVAIATSIICYEFRK